MTEESDDSALSILDKATSTGYECIQELHKQKEMHAISLHTARAQTGHIPVSTCMFDRAVSAAGQLSVTSNVLLKHGSSQHGTHRRASVASNCGDGHTGAHTQPE